jgi:endoglucanase
MAGRPRVRSGGTRDRRGRPGRPASAELAGRGGHLGAALHRLRCDGHADVSALAHADLAALHDPSTPALLADLRRQLDGGVQHAASDPFGAGASTLDFDSVPFTFGLVATAALYESASGDSSYRAFAAQQRAWALGANAWGSSFMVGAGTTYPRCPEHQVANLTPSGAEILGAVVNGPNEARKLDELNRFETMRPCAADGADGASYSVFDGRGSRYLDDVGAWQTVEPSLDFTSTALLAFSLTAAFAAEKHG